MNTALSFRFKASGGYKAPQTAPEARIVAVQGVCNASLCQIKPCISASAGKETL